MHKAALLFLALLAATTLSAQPRNAAYFELAGNAIAPSINYERWFTDRWYGRVGVTVIVSSDTDGHDDVTWAIPIMVGGFNNPAGNHHFESAGGLLLVTGDSQELFDDDEEEISNVAGTLTIGYRYQKPRGGFVFRAGLTPVFDTSGILPWAGVSFGYAW